MIASTVCYKKLMCMRRSNMSGRDVVSVEVV